MDRKILLVAFILAYVAFSAAVPADLLDSSISKLSLQKRLQTRSSLDNLIRALNDHDNLEEQKRQGRDLADIYNLMVRLWGDGLDGY